MKLVWVAPLLALTLAACGQIGAIGIPLGGGTPSAAATGQPTDFNQAAPTTPVETGQLPPATGYDPGPVAPTDPTGTPTTTPGALPDVLAPANAIGEPGQAAAVAANSGVAVRATDLLGGWTVTAGSDTCQLFMTLTAWTGGYRASTRNCASTVLQSISAWNIDGATVTLASADGTPVATLAALTATRFEGQVIVGGQPVVFYR